MLRTCIQCKANIKNSATRYCSNKCQADYAYKLYIDRWKRGQVSGSRGINAKNISSHILRYLNKKYNNACSSCGWSKVNATTNKVPLEIDHIDGDSNNNKESNLRLLCPNCHSLTSNFRNLNKGRGREWRRSKYVKVVS